MISLVPSESWGFFKWVWASARKWGVGPCPAQSVWQGSGFAADQTNAMLAVVRADDESLVPPQAAGLALSVARPLPTETASLGFGGSPVGGGNKNSRFAFFRHFCVAGVSLPSGRCGCVGTTPCGVYFGRKNGFLRVGALRRRTRCSLLHTALFRHFCVGGWYHYPRRALHAVETLDARGSRRRICRFCTAPEFALCGLNLPSSGTHATPAPNRAHSGSHAETRGVFTARDIGRVDRVNSLGTLCIVTFGTAQLDEPLSVAAAHHGGNTDFA